MGLRILWYQSLVEESQSPVGKEFEESLAGPKDLALHLELVVEGKSFVD